MSLTLSHAHPEARKAHICDDCGRTIAKGEIYRRWSGIGADGPYTWKSCTHCDAAAKLIIAADKDAVDPDYGLSVQDWLSDLGGDYGLTWLYEQYRARWADSAGELLPVPVGAVVGVPLDPEEQR